MPGLTTAGLQIATLADVRAQIDSAWLTAFGASMDVSDNSPDGQLIGIASEVWGLFWEMLEAVASSQDPDKATGVFLRALCQLTGTIPPTATFSTVNLTITGTPTSAIPSGSLVSTISTGQQFATVEPATIAVISNWAGSTLYAAGDRRANSLNAYLCITPGTSAASGGPTTTAANITDGTAHWRFLGVGTGAIDVIAKATETGPIVAASGDITSIDTPVGGWDGAINILDATPGRLELSDAALRVLRQVELATPGTSPADAIKAALLQVGANGTNPVTSATVFVNNSDVTDVAGVPPHSIECLVHGGEDQDIWDALLANVAAGIRTFGTEIGVSVDSSGTDQAEAFSRPIEIIVYVGVTLVKDPKVYPADGDDQVKLAIATRGNARDDGTDVVSSAMLASVFSIAGIIDVQLPLISADPITVPVATTTIPVSLRQRADFDTSRITVASSDGTP